MRITLTIDDQLVVSLKDAAHRSGKPFKLVVNEVLRQGLHALNHPKGQPYKLTSASLGGLRHVNPLA